MTMFRTGVRHGLAAASLTLVFGATAAHAQFNPFRGHNHVGLGKADTAMLFDAARQLNETDPLHPGDAKDWSNPDTGNAGTVKLVRAYKAHGLACHALRYDLSLAARSARSYNVSWCKTNEGWKIDS